MPKQLVLVSNDARLERAARQRGASAWSHERLLDFFDHERLEDKGAKTPEEKENAMSAEDAKALVPRRGTGRKNDATLRHPEVFRKDLAGRLRRLAFDGRLAHVHHKHPVWPVLDERPLAAAGFDQHGEDALHGA